MANRNESPAPAGRPSVLPQAAIDALNAEDAPWPSLRDWKAAARSDADGPIRRLEILVRGAEIAAPAIIAEQAARIEELETICADMANDRISEYWRGYNEGTKP